MAPIPVATSKEFIDQTLAQASKSSTRLPSFFLSHGSPFTVHPGKLEGVFALAGPNGPNGQFLSAFGPSLLKHYGDRIKGVIMFSAHWETGNVREVMSTDGINDLMYDFYGFDQELYDLKWRSKGSIELANKIVSLFEKAGMPAKGVEHQPLDHGTWVPYLKMWPNTNGEPFDIPILQVSLDHRLDMAKHIAIGKALAPLREEGILIFGSGSSVHNLRRIRETMDGEFAPPEFHLWEKHLSDIVSNTQGKERSEKLIELESYPHLRAVHPTTEHIIGLHVAAGAGEEERSKVICKDYGCMAIGFGL